MQQPFLESERVTNEEELREMLGYPRVLLMMNKIKDE